MEARAIILVLIAGCGSSSTQLDLTLAFDTSVSAQALSQVTALAFHATGDETYDDTLPVTRAIMRTETIVYEPRATTHGLTLRIDALDAEQHVVATGTTGSIPVSSRATARLRIELDVPALTGYPAAVLADAPLAYYRLDETSGTVASDSSGHGHDGTYGSLVQHTAGLVPSEPTSGAANFPGGPGGADSTVIVPANVALEPTQTISVEAWVDLADMDVDGYRDVLAYGDPTSEESYFLQILGHSLGFYASTSQQGDQSNDDPTLVSLVRTHVVGTYDGSQIMLYMNGTVALTIPQSGPIGGYSEMYGLALGGPNTSARTGYVGTLDEVAIYGTTLGAAQVTAHYMAGIAAP